MKMKRIFVFLLLLVFVVSSSSAQNRRKYRKKNWKEDMHKVYFAVGATDFVGELGGANKIGSTSFSLRDFDIKAVRPAVQIGYIYRFSEYFAWRSSFDYQWLSGNDKYTSEIFRRNRNLNFRTATYGLSSSLVFLYEIKQKGHHYNLRGVKGWRWWAVTPYIQAGIGGIYFNSKGNLNGSWYPLRPLCTEGQGIVATRKKYSPVQFVIPLGIGIRFKIGQQWEIGLEYDQTITFTDYLDDVSTTYFDEQALLENKGDLAVAMANPALDKTPGVGLYSSTRPGQQRGDPRDNDHFISLNLTVYYTINKGYVPKLRF